MKIEKIFNSSQKKISENIKKKNYSNDFAIFLNFFYNL